MNVVSLTDDDEALPADDDATAHETPIASVPKPWQLDPTDAVLGLLLLPLLL